MARRHLNVSDYPNLPVRGQEPRLHANEWTWNQGRTHSPQLLSENTYYSSDRRGSAPDYTFSMAGSYGIAPTGSHSTSDSAYTSATAPQQPLSELPVNFSPGRSSSLRGSYNPTHELSTHTYRGALLTHRSPYRLDFIHDRLSLNNRVAISIRGGHDQSINVPTSPRTAHQQQLTTRYEDVPPVSPIDGNSPLYRPLSQKSSVSPSITASPNTSLEGPVSFGAMSDRSRREALETCALEEPGCYVLVPTGLSPEEGNRPTDDARYYREKKVAPTKKGFRKPMEESERQAIKLNRKLGVCLRCKLFKEKCRGGIPCDRCRSLKVWKNICVPALFTEKSVFNREIYRVRVSSLLDNIRGWDPEQSDYITSGPECVEVHNGYKPKLRLKVYKFEPFDETLLQHILWRVSAKPSFDRIPSTNYGLKEELTAEALDDYLDQHVNFLIEEEIRDNGPCTPIYGDTVKAAYTYSRSSKPLSSLVRKALRIWIAQTFFFRSAWRLCGTNFLGMEPINDPESKLYGLTPLPRLVNQQLDFYVESRVAALEKEMLGELQSHILDRNSYDWFGIFLTIYIHLSSLERDTWSLNNWEHDSGPLNERVKQLELRNPQWGSQKAWIWPVRVSPSDLIAKNAYLADILVSHFRTISRGYVPFTLDWDQKQVIQMAGSEKEAVQYMKAMSQQVGGLEQYLMARQAAQYSRDNCNSLTGKFTAKLMLSDGET